MFANVHKRCLQSKRLQIVHQSEMRLLLRKCTFSKFGAFSKTSFRIQLYKCNANAKSGNIGFIWNVPDEVDQVHEHQTMGEIEKLLPMFET